MKYDKNFKRIFSLVLSVLLLICFVPVRANADDYIEVTYLDGDEEAAHLVQEIKENMDSGWYAVTESELRFDNAIVITGEVNLILCDHTNTYAANGVYITEGSKLTIWAQSNDERTAGKLQAMPQTGPGIGGVYHTRGGSLVINGGYIIAYGGENGGAGIGGGQTSDMESVIINGGFVEAKSFYGGAGIGSGCYGDFNGRVEINGGYVLAVGSDGHFFEGGGAGIGAGFSGNAKNGKVVITGGTVIAQSQSFAAGIGGGEETTARAGGEGTDVCIYGGVVYASSQLCAIGHGGTNMDIGHSDSYMGNLDIGDYMMVSAGNDNIDDVEPFTTEERADACNYRLFARIEPCDNHEDDQLLYTDDENGRTHTANCKYCKYVSRGEDHVYDDDGHCVLCGGEGTKYTITFIYDNGIDDDKVVELIAGVEYKMPEFDGHLPEGKAFKCWLLENSTVSMEYAPGDLYSIDEHSTATAVYCDDAGDTPGVSPGTGNNGPGLGMYFALLWISLVTALYNRKRIRVSQIKH